MKSEYIAAFSPMFQIGFLQKCKISGTWQPILIGIIPRFTKETIKQLPLIINSDFRAKTTTMETSNDLIIYNCLSLSWVETQHVCLTFSWDENPWEQTERGVATYHLKFVNTRSLWVELSFISAKSQANTLSFNSTHTHTIVNNQVNRLTRNESEW